MFNGYSNTSSNDGWTMDKANALAALCENYPLQDAKKALDFVGFARKHLSGIPGAFDQFFDALQSLREGHLKLQDVLILLMIKCSSAPFVLLEFNQFLPREYSYRYLTVAQTIELITPTKTVHCPAAVQM
ncbi:uncharacterized protein TRAVEDRAFT_50079 [Trametes versicolor FP-101664 SS1]|uniref:uncharacterized protein n=1 Tax=Trametes versicolor (strain FP-101664) TaxID=717944 RepID=UPI00046242D7|nr:uncharacterized protein TRAVEDRAFT_50079 [Trametes versicolor FP-101664 SS1]EIW55594.1 hypothetical protein TRAVEDRAFT_50079 [Trametes versicolor FP-101664 SS1]